MPRKNWGRNTCFGVLGAVCSVSRASRSHARAMSVKINLTRWLCSRSTICRHSVARSLHSIAVIILSPDPAIAKPRALLTCQSARFEAIPPIA